MTDFANRLGPLYYLLLAMGLFLFAALIAIPKAKGEGFCYRGTVTTRTYAAPAKVVTHYSGTTNYGHAYAYKEYVPYAVEVQVNKDRYYSLSDLYRDRLYLEAFDLMREMRAKLNSLGGGAAPPTQPIPEPQHGTAPAPPPLKKVEDVPPKVAAPGGKTSAKALAILQASCYSCHNGDTAATAERPVPLRLDDPDSVSSELRWAAFGRAAVRDMPLPPRAIREKGGKELADWQAKNSLTDEQMKELLDGWVVVPVQTAKK